MQKEHSLIVKLCWSWIVLVSVVTIIHSCYRSWLIAQGLSGNEVENLLNPNQWNDPDYVKNPLMSYMHLIPGIIMYICGPIQFMESVRKKHKHIHRLSGFLFIAATIASGTASILMAFVFPVGGTSETISSSLFGSIMLFSVCKAFYHIREREILLHREWMIRAYMIGLGPGTMHAIIPFFIQVGGKDIGEALSLSLWLGFTIHLILAEVWIRNSKQAKSRTSRAVSIEERDRVSRNLGEMPVMQNRYEILV